MLDVEMRPAWLDDDADMQEDASWISPMSQKDQRRLEGFRNSIHQHYAGAPPAISSSSSMNRPSLQERMQQASSMSDEDIFFKSFGSEEELMDTSAELLQHTHPVLPKSRPASMAARYFQPSAETLSSPPKRSPSRLHSQLMKPSHLRTPRHPVAPKRERTQDSEWHASEKSSKARRLQDKENVDQATFRRYPVSALTSSRPLNLKSRRTSSVSFNIP